MESRMTNVMIPDKNAIRKLDFDLWIIICATSAVFLLLVIFQHNLNDFVADTGVSILVRTVGTALIQFGVAGLGITLVMIYRREGFIYFGLVRTNLAKVLVLSIATSIPYITYILLSGQFDGYRPLSIMISGEILASGFPTNVIGMTIIGVVWGFFEGFNYVVISNKINARYPSKKRFLNWGAIVCTVMCVLLHGVVGVTSETIFELISVVIVIYGMILIRDKYDNSWGVILIFVMLWNAF